MNGAGLAAPAAWNGWRDKMRARWRAFAPRERQAIVIAGSVLGVFLLWTLAVQPAWRTLRDAPAELDRLDAQLQHMQRLAAETRELRSAPAVAPAEAVNALKAGTERLGDKAKLGLLGDRATVTLTAVEGAVLRNWLAEVRSGARVRPVEAQLTRGPQGYSGSIVLLLQGPAQ